MSNVHIDLASMVTQLAKLKTSPRKLRILCTNEHFFNLLRTASPLSRAPHVLAFADEWKEPDVSKRERRIRAIRKLMLFLTFPGRFDRILIDGNSPMGFLLFQAIPSYYRHHVIIIWTSRLPDNDPKFLIYAPFALKPSQHIALTEDTQLFKWYHRQIGS